jgi:hypothetical protein
MKPECLVSLGKSIGSNPEIIKEIFSHACVLRALTGKNESRV